MSEPLRCPGCQASMIEVEEGEVTVDLCAECGGLWLDQGELELKGGRMPTHLVAISPKEERTCPRCGDALALFRGRLLEVDTCERCGGLYLDAGEIELLVAARRLESSDDEEGAPAIQETSRGSADGLGSERSLRFRCDFCRQLFPVSDQVVGELATACSACAKRLDVQHAPEARRARELEREEEQGTSTSIGRDPGDESFAQAAVNAVGEGAAEMVIEVLCNALFDLF